MLKKVLLTAFIAVASIVPAFAQGQFPSGYVQGNSTASAGQGSPQPQSAMLDRGFASTRGSILERGSGGWVAVVPSVTAGLPWVSGGSGADPLYQLLGIVGGGTNCSAASGTCLDNITGFASTGYVKRTGAGTYTFNNPIPVADGGTNCAAASGTCLDNITGFASTGYVKRTGAGAYSFIGPIPIADGGTNGATQQAALNNIMCTPTRAGDHAYWNGSNWVCFAGNNSGTQVFSENSSGVPAWLSNAMTFGGQSVALGASATVQGNGTKIQLASGSTTSSDCPNYDANGNLTDSTIKCGTLSNAVLATGAAGLNPTGTTSNAGKMMGLGVSSCRITLFYSTRVMVIISGNGTLATVGGQISANGYFADSGVTTAPANGAALTGTSFAANAVTIPSAGAFSFFVDQTILTGLTAGHTYWFDIGLFSDGTHTAAVQNTYCTAVEL